jgi:hypothetical protein
MRAKFPLLAMVWVALSAFAQTPTGTLQGTVIDQSGGAVTAASVNVTNIDTNEVKSLKTDASGHYLVPFLTPGTYTVTVGASGFRSAKEENIKVDISQNRSVDFTVNVGSTSSEVEVVASVAPLETNTSVMGQVIDHRKIIDLPLNGRNPFDLAALSPGVSTVGGASTPHIGGSRNGNNEQQIDGVTNITPENNVGNNGTAYTPIVDSVQEFSVQINALSAEYGRFGGGVINVVTKSGTNQIHGTGFEFARNAVLDANDFFSNRNGASKPDMHRNQYGGTVGGPIYIPGVYDGHNRSFFFFGFEGSKESDLATETDSVPIAPFRTGDFSSLGGKVYDPLTVAQDASGNLVRQPFSGNLVPTSRFDPVGVAAMSYYPAANAGAAGALFNNFFTVGNNTDNSKHWDTRIDHDFTAKWRMFLRFSHSTDVNNPLNDYGTAASQGWGGPTSGGAWSGSMDHTITISPTFVADFRYGVSRSNVYRYPYSQGFDLTKLGFPQEFASVAALRSSEFPNFALNNYSGLGPNGWVHLIENPLVHTATASLTKVAGRHNIKFGGEYRKLFLNFTQYGHPAGQFNFDNGWTQQTVNNFDGSGSSVASLLLGLSSSGSMTHEPTAADASTYFATYVQDDFKVSKNLTLNLGFRWDVDLPRTERYNQLSFWNPNAASPLQGQVPASACLYCGNLMGQMQFVGTQGAPYGRSQGPTQWKDFAPRIGFAYNAKEVWVVRSGFGIAYAPSALQAAGTSGAPGIEGFNTNTNMLPSADNQKTIHAYLSNPFPDGFNLPKGAATGPLTDVGTGIGDSFFSSYRNPYSLEWNFNVQRQLWGGMTFEAGYLGNRGLFLVDGDPGTTFSQLPASDLALGNQLFAVVNNPFYGIITTPGSPLAQPTITYNRLLRAFPQYDGVQSFRKPTASSMYHGLTLRLDKRFSNGVTFLVSFTGGKTMDNSASAVGYLGPTGGTRVDQYNGRLEWSVSPQDVSKNLVTSFAYDLPFGKGKHFLSNSGRLTNGLVAGWQANGILSFSTGTPIIISGANVNTQNALFTLGQRVDSTGVNGAATNPTINGWLNPAAFAQPAPFTFGNLSRTLPNVRNPGRDNADLSLFKNNYFGSENRYNLQFRIEAFNSLNHAQFGGPDTNIQDGGFGKITSTAVSPRQVQLAVKFYF